MYLYYIAIQVYRTAEAGPHLRYRGARIILLALLVVCVTGRALFVLYTTFARFMPAFASITYVSDDGRNVLHAVIENENELYDRKFGLSAARGLYIAAPSSVCRQRSELTSPAFPALYRRAKNVVIAR